MSSAIVGRSAADALQQYLEPLERALACFTPNVYLLRAGPRQLTPEITADLLTLADDVIELKDAYGIPRLALALEVYYRVEALPRSAKESRKRWTVRTLAYIYRLEDPKDPQQQEVAYHWHPHVPGIPFPHLHPLVAGGEAKRRHYAIPHATLKQVFTSAMRDFRVEPMRATWEGVLHELDAVMRGSLPT